jgi:hypothetical protein
MLSVSKLQSVNLEQTINECEQLEEPELVAETGALGELRLRENFSQFLPISAINPTWHDLGSTMVGSHFLLLH